MVLGLATTELACGAARCVYQANVTGTTGEICTVPDCDSVILGNPASEYNCNAKAGCNYTAPVAAIIPRPASCSNFGDASSRASCERRAVPILVSDEAECTRTGNVYTPAVTAIIATEEKCEAADGSGTVTGTGPCAAVILGFGDASKASCEYITGCTYTARISPMDARDAADATCTNDGDASSQDACERTGNSYLATGYWIEQDPTGVLPQVKDNDLDVRCGADVNFLVPVRLGFQDALRIASQRGARWGTSATNGRRRTQALPVPVSFYGESVAENSLVVSLDLHFLCPNNCTGPSGPGGVCNASSGKCQCFSRTIQR